MTQRVSVLYARESSGDKTEDTTLENQLTRMLHYASWHGISDPVCIQDKGYSGGDEGRPGWQRVLALMHADMLGTLVVNDMSRMHRNLLHAITFANAVRERGVRLVSLHENIDLSTDAGELQYNLLASVAEYYRKQTSSKIRESRRLARERGRKGPGHMPYGYDAVDGYLVPNDLEQHFIQVMANAFANGMGYQSIATLLNELNVPTKQGSTWHANMIRRILRRVTAAG